MLQLWPSTLVLLGLIQSVAHLHAPLAHQGHTLPASRHRLVRHVQVAHTLHPVGHRSARCVLWEASLDQGSPLVRYAPQETTVAWLGSHHVRHACNRYTRGRRLARHVSASYDHLTLLHGLKYDIFCFV